MTFYLTLLFVTKLYRTSLRLSSVNKVCRVGAHLFLKLVFFALFLGTLFFQLNVSDAFDFVGWVGFGCVYVYEMFHVWHLC